MNRRSSVVACLALVVTCLALGRDARTAAADPGVSVTAVRSRPAIAGDTGVVYATIVARANDALLGGASPICDHVELHRSTESTGKGATSSMAGMAGSSGGMMAMEPVARLPLPRGTTVRLATGGYHLMLVGLHRDLEAGAAFPVTFRFAKAGLVRTTAVVKPF